MITILSLWLPILISAVIVFLASMIVWPTLHRSDYKGLPDEEAAVKALRPQNLRPGMYNIPNIPSRADLKKPEIIKKFKEGPIGLLTVLPNGAPSMGKNLLLSIVYYLVIGIFVAYVAGRTLPAGAAYLTVFRLTGTVAWLAYGAAVIPEAIWFGRPWKAVGKTLIDALIYGLLTAGAFGWLWPN
jgi:hypothetical protein